MDEVEFLFQCIRDGKLSKGQAEAILNKKSSSTTSALQKTATFLPGFSQFHHREDSKGTTGSYTRRV